MAELDYLQRITNKKRVPNFRKWELLSDKIQDEQWSTHKIKALWKKDPKFGKWFDKNVDTKPGGHRFYPSEFRGEYGEDA